jgi:hypothetical protein
LRQSVSVEGWQARPDRRCTHGSNPLRRSLAAKKSFPPAAVSSYGLEE